MSHLPNLIEPSPIVVEQLDAANTAFDTDAREPIKTVGRAAQVTLSAQVSWGRSSRYSYRQGGQAGHIEEATGYLVFLTRDLDAASVTLARGDKCVTIGGRPANVFLTNRLYAGHHHGEPHLEIWDFADNQPKRGR